MVIRIEDDFSPEKIIKSGQCFRGCGLSLNSFRFITGRHELFLTKAGEDTYRADCSDAEWKEIWEDYFDLGRNYTAVRQSIPAEDVFLTEAAAYGRGIRILRQDPWEMLITFIISQRKNIPAIRQCVEKLCRRYGAPISGRKEYAFPEPDQLAAASQQELRALGLGYRAPYIVDAASAILSGKVSLEELKGRSPQEAIDNLQQIRGVGIKVASCVCLFGLGMTSPVPVDVWIRRVLDQKYGGKNPWKRYGDNAGIAQQYAFYYAVSHRDEFR